MSEMRNVETCNHSLMTILLAINECISIRNVAARVSATLVKSNNTDQSVPCNDLSPFGLMGGKGSGTERTKRDVGRIISKVCWRHNV